MSNFKRNRTKDTWRYKGFTVVFIDKLWRAEAYSNPSFYSTKKVNIIKQINEYLKDEREY